MISFRNKSRLSYIAGVVKKKRNCGISVLERKSYYRRKGDIRDGVLQLQKPSDLDPVCSYFVRPYDSPTGGPHNSLMVLKSLLLPDLLYRHYVSK